MGSFLIAYQDSQVKPGWIAFFLVLALIVATVLLWRNMNKQLGRIKVPTREALLRDSSGGDDGESDGLPGSGFGERPTEPPGDDQPPTSPRAS